MHDMNPSSALLYTVVSPLILIISCSTKCLPFFVCDPLNLLEMLSYVTDSLSRLISLCRIGDAKCGDIGAHFMELAIQLGLQESTNPCSTTLEESGQ